MELDTQTLLTVAVAAASSYLLIVIIRKVLEAINKASKGKFYENSWVKTAGVFFDTLLPVLPVLPSGFLTMWAMSYWPPAALWDNALIHFMVGCLAGVVAAQLYYLITRGIKRQVERAGSKTPDEPKDDPADPPSTSPS